MDPQYLRDAYEIGQELEDARYIIACLRAELSAFEKQRSEAAKKFVIACTDRPDDWPLFYESDAVTPAVTIGDLRCLLDLVSRADAAVAEAKALREERDDWRAQYITARDALHPLTYPPDPITLRAIADEIDCGRDCESGYTEHDTNAFVCRKEERGECGWSKAEELRAFASAVEARRATLAQPAATKNCERCQGSGEIVTDWDVYQNPPDGSEPDAGVAECPDCGGGGHQPAADGGK